MKTLALVLVLSASAAHAAPIVNWEKCAEERGIQVYRKNIEGSNLLAFKGEGVVDAPLDKVATVIFDTTRAKEWIEDLEETKLLRWLSPTEFLEYDHVGTPIVLKDRDFLSRVTMTVDPKSKQMTFLYRTADPADAPEELRKTSYVRGELDGTKYLLTSVEGDTRTKVEGEIYADPKGSVPKWIVNMFQKDWPVTTLTNLRKQVQKPDVKVDPRIHALIAGQADALTAPAPASAK